MFCLYSSRKVFYVSKKSCVSSFDSKDPFLDCKEVKDMCLIPNTNLVVIACSSGVKIFDLVKRTQVDEITSEPSYKVAARKDGRYLAFCQEDGFIKVHDREKQEIISSTRSETNVKNVYFKIKEQTLVIHESLKSVSELNFVTSDVFRHGWMTCNIVGHCRSERFYVFASEKKIFVLDYLIGEIRSKPVILDQEDYTEIVFSPNRRVAALLRRDKNVFLIDLYSNSVITNYRASVDSIEKMCFNETGSILFFYDRINDRTGKIQIWKFYDSESKALLLMLLARKFSKQSYFHWKYLPLPIFNELVSYISPFFPITLDNFRK